MFKTATNILKIATIQCGYFAGIHTHTHCGGISPEVGENINTQIARLI